jgi:uncharacterized protein
LNIIENLFKKDHLRTYSGRYIDPLNPNPDDIMIDDIAHSLARCPRWAGQTAQLYTVAEHSMDVMARVQDPADKLEALLHDAAEYLFYDLGKPLKDRLPDYYAAEKNLSRVCAEKFGYAFPKSQAVGTADMDAMQWEWDNYVLQRGRWVDPPHRLIKLQFLQAYEQYKKR